MRFEASFAGVVAGGNGWGLAGQAVAARIAMSGRRGSGGGGRVTRIWKRRLKPWRVLWREYATLRAFGPGALPGAGAVGADAAEKMILYVRRLVEMV